MVRVAGDGAGATVGDLAGDGAEGVPDGGAAAVFLSGALDLVAVDVIVVSRGKKMTKKKEYKVEADLAVANPQRKSGGRTGEGVAVGILVVFNSQNVVNYDIRHEKMLRLCSLIH